MHVHSPGRPAPAIRRSTFFSGRLAGAGALLVLASGCQSYRAAPLDLQGHREQLSRRALDVETLKAYAARLRASIEGAPDRFSLDDGVSLSEGEVFALCFNRDLRLARLRAGVALATYENAGLWQDPVFGFDGAEILSASAPFEFGLMLRVTIPISGRLEVEKARAGAAYDAELRRIHDAEWRTRAEVRRAWAAWSAAEELAALARGTAMQIERIMSITDQLEAAGELGRVETRLFRVESAERRAALAGAELDAVRARITLLGLMGLAPDAPLQLLPAFPAETPWHAGDAAQRIIEANTELAVARAEHAVAEESLRLEIRKQHPDITIGAGYGSEDNDDRLLLGTTVPIPIFNANRAEIAEARARRQLARAAAETLYESLLERFALAQAALAAVRAQRAGYEADILPMLAEQSADVDRIVQLGEIDTLLLLDTVKREHDAKSRLLDLRLAELDAAIAMTTLLGPPPPVTRTGPESPETGDEPIDAPGAAGGGE